MTVEEANKAVLRRYWEEAVNGRDLGLLDELVSEGFEWGEVRGPEGLREYNERAFAAFPDLRDAVEEQLAVGDRVVTRVTVSGTHEGAFMGVPATGKRVAFQAILIDRLEGGRMVGRHGLVDAAEALRQIGAIPGPE